MLNKLFYNWSLKFLALAIALAMWIFVVGQEKSEISVRVPIELTNIPSNYMIIDEIINEVDIRLHGPRTLVRLAVEKHLSKIINLNNLGIGTHIFQIDPNDLQLPPGVRVLRINPDTFRLTLVPCLARDVPVQPVIKGKPALGYELIEVDLKPTKVTVIGPREEVAELDYVFTLPLDINDRREAFSQFIQLRLPRERNIRLSQGEVEVVFNIRSRPTLGLKSDLKNEGKQDYLIENKVGPRIIHKKIN